MTSTLPESTTVNDKFFKTYDGKQFSINSDTYNQVYNFFRSRTTSDLAAQQLTQNMIIMTNNNKLDPLTIMQQLATNNTSDIKYLVITFFNSTKDSYSKLGFSNTSNSNFWVDRNIVA